MKAPHRHPLRSMFAPTAMGSLLVLGLPARALAQDADGGFSEPVEQAAPSEEAPAAEATLGASGSEHAGALLSGLATHAASARQVGGLGLLTLGAVSLGAGALAKYQYETSYGDILFIAGGLSMVSGVLSFFSTSPLEKLAMESGPDAPGFSPEALEAAWRAEAEDAHSKRTIAGWVNVVLGIAGVGTGVAIVAGVGDLDDQDKSDYGTTALVAGGAFVSGGIAALLLESEMERGFDLAYPSQAGTASTSIDFGVAALPNGAAVQVVGSF